MYVPNEYVAAGRTAHSVIDPNCRPGDCRYWIANAGGGVWRTNDPFAAEPKWEYLSGDFQHNNTAALELDPNDSTSNVIYAGTGEPNTCRSGCIAGVGLYKSKDGGNHWSGPIGTQYFAGRGIGSIQVKPGDPSTIFVGLRRPGLAWHQQHLLHRRRPRREHPRRSALRALAVHRRWCRRSSS